MNLLFFIEFFCFQDSNAYSVKVSFRKLFKYPIKYFLEYPAHTHLAHILPNIADDKEIKYLEETRGKKKSTRLIPTW